MTRHAAHEEARRQSPLLMSRLRMKLPRCSSSAYALKLWVYSTGGSALQWNPPCAALNAAVSVCARGFEDPDGGSHCRERGRERGGGGGQRGKRQHEAPRSTQGRGTTIHACRNIKRQGWMAAHMGAAGVVVDVICPAVRCTLHLPALRQSQRRHWAGGWLGSHRRSWHPTTACRPSHTPTTASGWLWWWHFIRCGRAPAPQCSRLPGLPARLLLMPVPRERTCSIVYSCPWMVLRRLQQTLSFSRPETRTSRAGMYGGLGGVWG